MLGVAAGIAEKVAQDSRDQAQVGTHGEPTTAHTQTEPGCFSHRLKLGSQWRQHLVQAVQVQVRLDRRLVEPGDIQQVGEQVLGALQGLVCTLHQLLFTRGHLALAQGGDQ
ncbi:hypothetical protein D9M71_719570 [compost metagenome]